ncbi:helix-turn-helix domain-containing protein [Streptococcus troglodytae]|uniref:helix-turn-helix domain-containing protein n=1 Tax=Streptococcus troglodytae TaxID=1111760 RepID=UPI0027E4FEED|nr:LysR family transcriptional regulator [Streptococcus troglodytae]
MKRWKISEISIGILLIGWAIRGKYDSKIVQSGDFVYLSMCDTIRAYLVQRSFYVFTCLAVFLVVAEEKNVTRTGGAFAHAQPTLSRHLKALEEELGVDLFKCSNHRIYLTENRVCASASGHEISWI